MARAEAPTVQLSATVDYSSGYYGASERTDAVIEPILFKLISGPWQFRLLVPFASIRGPADITVVADEGAGETVDGVAEEQTEPGGTSTPHPWRSGLSDISLAVTRSFDRIGHSPAYVDTTLRIRLPTGDRHAGLGSGAVDEFLDGEVGGDWKQGGAYLNLGYRFLGDLNDHVRTDGWQGSVGGWWNPGRRIQIGASFDWRASSVPAAPAYQLAGGYVSFQPSTAAKILISAGAGLSSSSPSFDASVTLILRPAGRRNQLRH